MEGLSNPEDVIDIGFRRYKLSGLPDNICYAAADKAIGACSIYDSSNSRNQKPETLAVDLVKKSLFEGRGITERHRQ
ncbi:hypothetical protein CCACVL1_24325 [Corchorus capsularis]|uniref:Uncharacterized protein n=1 Tax=Corchorus capsularis TaxID=210143 RepID=A0A1R3GQ86_COCAP|nr:hypothetical protein CCACVL1_24325 [Corchorus capsularis]